MVWCCKSKGKVQGISYFSYFRLPIRINLNYRQEFYAVRLSRAPLREVVKWSHFIYGFGIPVIIRVQWAGMM